MVGVWEEVREEENLEGNRRRRGTVPNLCTIGIRLPKEFVIMSLHALRDFAYQTAVL